MNAAHSWPFHCSLLEPDASTECPIFVDVSAAKPVIGKLVCSCSQVGSGNIEEAIKSGTTNFTELCKSTGAGLGCGSCKTEVKEILAKCK